ncbi:2Fe-2S iron-sulfur cluster-binding protein [Hyphococcus sp.]|uniref:2Fe-2S iron-sulfur cluster-binding protein n=1 Tax=Hyphococcus sp. TaxID=2038636 RepID=UPI0035C6B362
MRFFNKLLAGPKARRVSIHAKNENFEVGKNETILESALKNGINYPHDCTVGTCGSCRTRLLSGNVEAITPFGYTLSKEELEAGYILACQALPKSDLEIDVDIASGGAIEPVTQGATLVSLEALTHDIKKVVWRVEKPMFWRAGQYMNVRWNNSSDHRSYSFATAPSRRGATELTTFIRHVPGGALTDQIFEKDPYALTYEIDGPHGNFWLRSGDGPILCIAGGSGLAPILGVLQHAAENKVRRDCILLFGARGQRDLYCSPDIAAVRNAWTAGFDFWQVLSEEQNEKYRYGLVTDYIEKALEKLGPGAQAYLCGPPPMIDAAIKVLTEQCKITLDNIFYDKFTDASSKK